MTTPDPAAAVESLAEVLIRQGALSGRWYAITKWHRDGGHIIADEKHDVHDQISSLLAARTPVAPSPDVTPDQVEREVGERIARAIEADRSMPWNGMHHEALTAAARIARQEATR